MAEIVNLDALIPREDFIAPIDNSGSPGAGGKESEAVDLAFGPYAKFGTIVKDYRNASMPYTPSEMVGTKLSVPALIGPL